MKPTKIISTFINISFGILLTACGGGGGGSNSAPPPPPPPPVIEKGDVNTTFAGIQTWTEYSPIEISKDGKIEGLPEPIAEDEIVGTLKYSCKSTEYNIVDTPKEIVILSPNESVLWLGSLIQGDSYKEGLGSFTELAIRERAPLKISIDLLTGENFKIVENPSLTSVNSAIGELIKNATDSGLVNSNDSTYTEEITHSTSQSALKFGISAYYLGSKASADLEFDQNAQETTLTAYFYQKMFTAAIELPPTPDDFFSNDFTQAKLDKAVSDGLLGNENPPVYIANIAYGRILMYTFTSKYEEKRMRAAISASYDGVVGGGAGYSDVELQTTLNEAKIQVTALGGANSGIEALIRTGNLKSYFNDNNELTSARPMSYQLNQLKVGNPIAKVTESTDYAIKECTFVEDTAQPIGELIKVELVDVLIKYDCDPGADPGDIYGSFSIDGVKVFNISSNNTVTKGSGNTLPIDKSWDMEVYYNGNTLRNISGRLVDQDGGLNGGDDNVGTWNFNRDLPNHYGNHSKVGTSQCGSASTRPVLHYKVSRINYLY